MAAPVRGGLRRFIAACLLGLSPAITACARSGAADADAQAARAHVDMLAGTIGSRPIGSAANARARAYLVGVLEQAGFEVRLQRAEGVDDRAGLRRVTPPARNIIAWRDGTSREAIALVSHYDSVPEGPGALDDALGVAVCVESAKHLVAEPRRYSLFVVITDGEESGLLGARAAAKDPELATRVRAFLNFDGTGAAGPLLMFEAGPGRGSALDAWAEAAPWPEGASFTTEIYRRLPNDTDFTAFKTIEGVSGLNFAPVLDSYAYHTDRDVPERVQASTLRQGIANTTAIVRALDRTDLTVRAEAPSYFSLFGRMAIVYGANPTRALAGASVALAIGAWVVVIVVASRVRGLTGVALTALWSAVTVAGIAGGAIGATWALRAIRGQLNPWYASPHWYFMLIILAGAAGGWCVRRVAWLLPPGARPVRSPATVWLTALPTWAGLAFVAAWTAPGASYLIVVPLLAAGLLLLVTWRTPARMRGASFVVLVVAGSLWVGNLTLLLRFLVAMFGWFPIVAPPWMFPAVIGTGALMVVPPLVGALSEPARGVLGRTAVGAAVIAMLAAVGVMAYRAPAFTEERPQVRSARYVQDGPRGEAWWEVASLEPRLDLARGPEGADWQSAEAPLQTSAALILRRPAPFVFRTRAAAPVEAPPVDVTAILSELGSGQMAYDVTIAIRAARDPAVVELTLPPGLTPITSSLSGTVGRDGTWRAGYVAPPADGLQVHLVVPASGRDGLQKAVVTLQVPGLPGSSGSSGLPAWLPTAATTWRSYSWYLVSAAPAQATR